MNSGLDRGEHLYCLVYHGQITSLLVVIEANLAISVPLRGKPSVLKVCLHKRLKTIGLFFPLVSFLYFYVVLGKKSALLQQSSSVLVLLMR